MASFLSGPSESESFSPDDHRTNTGIRLIACVTCQRRKIKCNRDLPCNNCIKSSTPCVPGTPAPARGRRPYNQALKARLARCEELLNNSNNRRNDSGRENGTPQSAHSHTPTEPSHVSKWTTDGKLVENPNGKVTFMDNYLIGMVNDELRAMHELINLDEKECNNALYPKPSMSNSDLILDGENISTSTAHAWPSPAVVFKLWQTFLDRVNPFTKVIHVPSLQPFVVEATNGPRGLSSNIMSLMLSIFLMAVISMTEDECGKSLGISKESATVTFSEATQQALRHLDFMRTDDLVVLQTLCLYMYSLQAKDDRHSSWVLSGTVIRIAQKMGLHRDGRALGLGPFETEMRRRIWWQLVSLDSKFALFSGFGHSLLPRDWDVQEPSNLNDADIFPTATLPTLDRDGPSEMVICLIRNKLTKFLVDTPGLEPVKMAAELNSLAVHPPLFVNSRNQQMGYYLTQFDILEEGLQHILEYRCNTHAGQAHVLAQALGAGLIVQKGQLMRGLNDRSRPEAEGVHEAEGAFLGAAAFLEHIASLYEHSQSNGSSWFADFNFQYDILLYVVVLLGQRVDHYMGDRAWENIATIYRFRPGLLEASERSCLVLGQAVLTAWAKRRDFHSTSGLSCEDPEYIVELRAQTRLNDNVGDEDFPFIVTNSGIPAPSEPQEWAYPLGVDNGVATNIEDGELPFMDTITSNWAFLTPITEPQSRSHGKDLEPANTP